VIIGACTVVTSSVPARSVVRGSPAVVEPRGAQEREDVPALSDASPNRS